MAGFGVGFDVAGHRGLEPGETEGVRSIARAGHPAREPKSVTLPGAGQIIEGPAARIAQAKQSRDLVIGLARGIVEGAAEFYDRLSQ